VASFAPLTGAPAYAYDVRVQGSEDLDGESITLAINNVSEGYFETLDIGLMEGRFFTAADDTTGDRVAVLGQGVARRLFPDASPLGRVIEVSLGGNAGQPARVVGVVHDTRDHGLQAAGVHAIYTPARQTVWGSTFIVAAEGEPTALARFLTETIHALDPDRPVDRIRTMRELRAADVAPSRLNATLFGGFAVLALLIATVGVLAVLAFSVSQRTREFGIRMALGEGRGSLLGRVLTEGVLMAGIALLVGGGGAVMLGRLLAGYLYGVEPVDTASLMASAALLGAATVLAALLPAVRATLVDPQTALKAE